MTNNMVPGSKVGELNSTDVKKWLIGLLMATIGSAIAYLDQQSGAFIFSGLMVKFLPPDLANSLGYVFYSAAINALRKWLMTQNTIVK